MAARTQQACALHAPVGERADLELGGVRARGARSSAAHALAELLLQRARRWRVVHLPHLLVHALAVHTHRLRKASTQ
jgi:hypothetical protein